MIERTDELRVVTISGTGSQVVLSATVQASTDGGVRATISVRPHQNDTMTTMLNIENLSDADALVGVAQRIRTLMAEADVQDRVRTIMSGPFEP